MTLLDRLRGTSGVPIILLILASAALVVPQVPANEEISPYDEYVYLDYLSKVPTQGVVRYAEETGEVARNEISCRGVVGYGSFGEQCGGSSHEEDIAYPYAGKTGADIYTPLYFGLTWIVAQPLTTAGVGLLDAGRLVGVLWLSAGALLLFSLLRLLGSTRALSTGLTLAVVATPVIFWSSTYLSTDAPTLAASAGFGCLTVLVARRRASAWWLAPAAVLVTLLKLQNFAAVGLWCGALLVHAVLGWREGRHDEPRPTLSLREIAVPILAPVLAVVAQALWMVVRASLAVPGVDPAAIDVSQKALSLSALAEESFRFIRAVGDTGMNAHGPGIVASGLLTIATVAGVAVPLFKLSESSRDWVPLAAATLFTALAMGPLLAIAAYIAGGQYVPLPLRYGLVLLPAFVACAAMLLRRWGRAGDRWVLASGALLAVAAVVA